MKIGQNVGTLGHEHKLKVGTERVNNGGVFAVMHTCSYL